MGLLRGRSRYIIDENTRLLRSQGVPEGDAVLRAVDQSTEQSENAAGGNGKGLRTSDAARRSPGDVLRDLATIRSGKMPDGSKAPEKPETPEVEADPVEEARMRMAKKRNQGRNPDVVLPASRKR